MSTTYITVLCRADGEDDIEALAKQVGVLRGRWS